MMGLRSAMGLAAAGLFVAAGGAVWWTACSKSSREEPYVNVDESAAEDSRMPAGDPSPGDTATGGASSDDESPTSGEPGSGQSDGAAAVQVNPANRAWLYYADGSPFFMCGPGDPEGFLYRGERRDDGTRDGDQEALIEKLAKTGANSTYMQAVRSHGGDGEADHNPFIDSDPEMGLDSDILDQWDRWFDAMDAAEIAIYLFIYDDSASIWDTGNEVGQAERKFVTSLVNRFEQHPWITWVIAEEYSEALSYQRVSKLAAIVREADDLEHPIAVHKHKGITFDEFADDPNIDQFAMQLHDPEPAGLHGRMIAAFERASGRYNLNMAEALDHGVGDVARRKNWAVAMGGGYVMALGWDIAETPVGTLEDCGRLRRFMEQTRFDTMAPHDDQAVGDTSYVLANPWDRFILYAAGRQGAMGVKQIDAGRYDLTWLDTVSGKTADQTGVEVAGGETTWTPPDGFGEEVALHVRQAD